METPTEKQIAERNARLAEGQCPIHGTSLLSFSDLLIFKMVLEQGDSADAPYLVHCKEPGCNVIAVAGQEGDTLLPQWKFLVDPAYPQASGDELDALMQRVVEAGKVMDAGWIDNLAGVDLTTIEGFLAASGIAYQRGLVPIEEDDVKRTRPKLLPIALKRNKKKRRS